MESQKSAIALLIKLDAVITDLLMSFQAVPSDADENVDKSTLQT